MSTTDSHEQNPYASFETEAARELSLELLPRKWVLWTIADGAHYGFIFGILSAIVLALFLIMGDPQTSSSQALPNELSNNAMLLEFTAQMLLPMVAGALLGLILGLFPRLPMALGIACSLLLAMGVAFQIFLMLIGSFGPIRYFNIGYWTVYGAGLFTALLIVFIGLCQYVAYVRRYVHHLAELALGEVSECQVMLSSDRWMERVLNVTIGGEVYRISYEGRSSGKEWVSVNGQKVAEGRSWLSAVPKFEFIIGSHHFVLLVTCWPWLTLRSLLLAIDGVVVYREGV